MAEKIAWSLHIINYELILSSRKYGKKWYKSWSTSLWINLSSRDIFAPFYAEWQFLYQKLYALFYTEDKCISCFVSNFMFFMFHFMFLMSILYQKLYALFYIEDKCVSCSTSNLMFYHVSFHVLFNAKYQKLRAQIFCYRTVRRRTVCRKKKVSFSQVISN